jgi:peptide-methionine (S)-S-oxide reductase
MQQALFGGGCFWCVEAVFLQIRGVEKVTSGYAGGHTTHPTYEQVCQGDTQHAEVVLIDFDEQQVTYSQLLDVFFATHDPTTLNRQGNDIGTQYRSVIYYFNEEQKQAAEHTFRLKNDDLDIVTEYLLLQHSIRQKTIIKITMKKTLHKVTATLQFH